MRCQFGSLPAHDCANLVSDKDAAPETPHRDEAVTQVGHASFPVDLTVLAQISGGDRSVEDRMLRAFRKSNESDAAALREAVERADLGNVAQVSHRLMGAARMGGALLLASICDSIEQAALAGNWDGVAAYSAACYRELERVNAYLCTLVEI